MTWWSLLFVMMITGTWVLTGSQFVSGYTISNSMVDGRVRHLSPKIDDSFWFCNSINFIVFSILKKHDENYGNSLLSIKTDFWFKEPIVTSKFIRLKLNHFGFLMNELMYEFCFLIGNDVCRWYRMCDEFEILQSVISSRTYSF